MRDAKYIEALDDFIVASREAWEAVASEAVGEDTHWAAVFAAGAAKRVEEEAKAFDAGRERND